MSPTVSVCVPAYNSAAYIGTTIQSILDQTFVDFELIVVDDASTDGTGDIVAGFDDERLTLVRNEKNLGAVANWNKAMSLAGGQFVKLVCGDDELMPECLERQVAVMRANPEVVIVAGKRDIVDETGASLLVARGLSGMSGTVSGAEATRVAVRSGTNPLGEPACVLLRAEAAKACGPFRGHVPYMIDLEYWLRMLEHGCLFALDDTVARFRVVGTSWSNRIAWSQSAHAVRLFRELTRRGRARWHDALVGSLRALLLNFARMLLYRILRVRARRPLDSTTDVDYTERLRRKQEAWWKRALDVQAPYRWNLRRLRPGFMLDVGCGLGRNLMHISGNGVGVDHNAASVAVARSRGLTAFTPSEFFASEMAQQPSFDSLLLSHLLEHMSVDEAVDLLDSYLGAVRPGGSIIAITPQERGFRSDPTHVEFMDFDRTREVMEKAGLTVVKQYSFPFPRALGRVFVYNEFVTVAAVSSGVSADGR